MGLTKTLRTGSAQAEGAQAESPPERGGRAGTGRTGPLEKLDDGGLMERYRDGEAACFDVLVRRHQGPVFRFFLRHVGDIETSEDLTQETFIRVVHNRASFRTGAKFTTWVYTIARNLSVDEMRKRRYRRHRSLDEPLGGRDGDPGRTLADLVGDPQARTEAQAGDLEMRTVLEASIARLPEEQREVFTLREMGGLSFQEIAEVVGCNENTVKSRMRYALERLHAALRGRVEESGECVGRMSDRLPAACEARKDDLAALALGESLGGRDAALQAHVATCAGCKAYLAMMASTVGAVRSMPQPEPSADLTARILFAAREAETSPAAAEGDGGPLGRFLAAVAAAFRRPAFASAFAAAIVASAAVVLLLWNSATGGTPGRDTSGPVLARLEQPVGSPVASPALPEAPHAAPTTTPSPSPAQPSAAAPEPNAGTGGAGIVERLAAAPAATPGEAPTVAVVTGTGEAAGGVARRLTVPTDQPTHVALTQPVRNAEEERTQPVGGARAAGQTAQREDQAGGGGQAQDVDTESRFRRGTEISGDLAQTGTGATGTPVEDQREPDGEQLANLPGQINVGSETVAVGVASTGSDEQAEWYDSSYRQEPARPAVVTTMPSAPPATPAPPAPAGASATTTAFASESAPSAPAQQAAPLYGFGGMDGVDTAAGAAGPPATAAAVAPDDAESMDLAAEEAGRTPPADDMTVARDRLAAGRPAEAEAVLEEALRSQESNGADVTFLLAETHARQGKWGDAARTYELFLARYLDDPRAAEARWRAADAYRRAGSTTRAVALLRQLVDVPGYDSRAREELDEISVETTAGEGSAPAYTVPAEPLP